MATSTTIDQTYQYLEHRPGSNYREIFLEGRRIRASVVARAGLPGLGRQARDGIGRHR
jgi:hypothetical protein